MAQQLFDVLFLHFFDTIFKKDFKVKEMSNCNFDVRNEFSTSKLVEIDFLNTKMAKNKNSMVTSIFQWRPSWIAYCHLMPGIQDGRKVPSTIINQ